MENKKKSALLVLDMINDIDAEQGKINSWYATAKSNSIIAQQNKVILAFRQKTAYLVYKNCI